MARAPQVPGGTTPQPEPAESKPEASGLPRPEDVDPTRIKRAVLTTAGWVCPSALPVPARE